jgi:hypothetical protein
VHTFSLHSLSYRKFASHISPSLWHLRQYLQAKIRLEFDAEDLDVMGSRPQPQKITPRESQKGKESAIIWTMKGGLLNHSSTTNFVISMSVHMCVYYS